MKVKVVIPSRFQSSRFPGKPLAVIAGKTMLKRVWQVAVSAVGEEHVIVATDDQRIFDHAELIGARVVMTSTHCRNGTERVHEALKSVAEEVDVVVNLQGDSPLTPPWIVQDVLAAFADPGVDCATPAVRLSKESYEQLKAAKQNLPASGTLVVFDRNMDALYFSKKIIPFYRDTIPEKPFVFRHIGLYAYRKDALARYLKFEQTQLEHCEGLEQLRALENGMAIRVVETDFKGRSYYSVDAEADVSVVEAILATEGEFEGASS